MRYGLLACLALCAPSALASPAPRLQHEVDPLDLHARRFSVAVADNTPVRLTCEARDGSGERHRLEAPATGHRLPTLRGLKADTRYRCHAELLDGSSRRTRPVTFLTAPLPDDLTPPVVTVASVNPAATGYTLYNYGVTGRYGYTANYLVIIDAEGNVRWYYRGPYRNGVGGGDVDVSWLGSSRLLFGGDIQRNFPPTIVGLDKRIRFEATPEKMSPTDLPEEFGHDIGLSRDGRSIFYLNSSNVFGVGSTTDDSNGFVMGFLVKELELATGDVVWAWDSVIDGYDRGGLPDPGAPYSAEPYFTNDPYHANSIVDQWEDGRLYLYVGLRNNNSILKIDHATKEVVWTLGVDGDFTLLEVDGTQADDHRWFFSQHDAQVHGNHITLYDNGWDREWFGGEPYSRALRLEIDETRMTARIVSEYTERNWLEGIFGGHDLLPSGNSFIALGHTSFSYAYHPSGLIEVDPGGQVVWRADFQSAAEVLYRAERIPGCDIFNDERYCPRNRGR